MHGGKQKGMKASKSAQPTKRAKSIASEKRIQKGAGRAARLARVENAKVPSRSK